MKKRYFLLFLFLLAFFAGILMMLYPVYRTRKDDKESSRKIERFNEYVEAATESPSEIQALGRPDVLPGRPFSALRSACEAYNLEIFEQHQRNLDDTAMKAPGISPSDYGYEQEIFCCLSIPAQNFEVPVYLGASSHNLDRGAAVLGQTSLPIGGKSTNCVIAGHRCWKAAIKFRVIESLDVGDSVFLKNPWETLEYRVVEAGVISPSAIEPIVIREGRDLLTLFTCTRGSRQRYLVTCERVPQEVN